MPYVFSGFQGHQRKAHKNAVDLLVYWEIEVPVPYERRVNYFRPRLRFQNMSNKAESRNSAIPNMWQGSASSIL